MELSERGGSEWVIISNGRNKVCFERYSMDRGKGGVKEGGTGAPEVRSD